MRGQQTPVEADPTGQSYAFEAGAIKQGSKKQGWADVWKRGHFAWEYKGPRADLELAYQQVQLYREALENPPLLIVSDMEIIEIHTNFTGTVKRKVVIDLDDILTPAGQQHLRNIFENPNAFKAGQTTEEVTTQAAREFAKLAELLRRYDHDPHDAAHFLIRLLFCLFAEDIGLLPSGLFTRLLTQTRGRAEALTRQLRVLFEAMAGGGWFGTDEILRFNGRLFDDARVLDLDSDSVDILARVARLDWSSIEPAIVGTLFERSLDPAKRSQLGAHYTSRDDILLIVEPVLMRPLRRDWEKIQLQARELDARRRQVAGPQRAKLDAELQRLLLGFQHQLTQVRVLDPACGSGNFLYVALKQLLDLEKEVGTFMVALDFTRPFAQVSPEQLYGVEVNEYAHELAQLTVWIGYIQWLRDNGLGRPSEPILKKLDTIRRMDAILAFDEQGRPVEPAWPDADVIIGNPPFLGGNKIRKALGDQYVDRLFALYENRVPAFADLVCYWFERAREQIAQGKVKRAGLLATQGIRGGANRKVLEQIKETGDVFWAQADRNWILDGATVHVSMIGFDNGSEIVRELDDQVVSKINADLTAMVDLTQAQPIKENLGICFMGPSAKAPFDIHEDIASRLINAPRNINGRPNSDVIRPVASAIDLVQRSRRKWTIDFALMPLEEASEYEAPFEYVREHVLPVREQRRSDFRGQWWQYARPRVEMRLALNNKSRYIATPGVAKHRIFVWMDARVLCNQGTLVFAREDDYFFGVLHSKLHELWARGTGTQLREAESGFRYTPTSTFETFPFPWPPGQEPAGDALVEAIAQAARELNEKRERWLNPEGASEAELKKRTLTNLYNERPTWLDLAHRKLDRAVLDAYGWPHDLPDEEILARLLALNLSRGQGSGVRGQEEAEDEGVLG